MTWTADRPTKSGYYWVRMPAPDSAPEGAVPVVSWSVVAFLLRDGVLVSDGGRPAAEYDAGALFAGPLTPPPHAEDTADTSFGIPPDGLPATVAPGPYRRCWRWDEQADAWEEVRVEHLEPGDRFDMEKEPGSRERMQCVARGEPTPCEDSPGRWGIASEVIGTVEVD